MASKRDLRELLKLESEKKWSVKYQYDDGDLIARTVYVDKQTLKHVYGRIPETITIALLPE